MTGSDRSDERALRAELGVIGLSDTEIDTYLALLARGEATTRTVAEDADVTQRAVYDIAERLANRGLVRVNDHASPTTIRALAPAESITRLTERLDSITPALTERFNETKPKAPEIQMVKSRDTALKRLRSAISGATREVVLAIPEPVYPEIESELRAAVERSVFVLLLLGETADCDGNERTFAGAADLVRCWEESLTFLYVVDDTVAMIGDPSLLSGTHTGDEAVVVSEQSLAGSILGLHLSGYWPAGAEAFVADPDPLPQTFEWFREALVHATLHHRAGTDIHVEVVTTSGEEIAGPVAGIRQALVEPATNEFTLQASLSIATSEGIVTIGGRGSFVEDYEAASITLRSDS